MSTTGNTEENRKNPFFKEVRAIETALEMEPFFKVPSAPGTSCASFNSEPQSPQSAAAGVIKDARIHREVMSFQGGNLKMTVFSKPGLRASSSTADSLDAISIAANIFDDLENKYLTNRTDYVSQNGLISTPLHVLKRMSEEFQVQLHSETFLINNSNVNQTFRVELFVGTNRGIGQAPRRPLANQMAALDLLEKMKIDKDINMLPYAFLPGWRTSNHVYNDLKQFCCIHDFATPSYRTLGPGPYDEGPLYTVQCQIGDLVETAKSDDRFLAKKLAARQMFDKMSGGTGAYPDEDVEMGKNCISRSELKEYGIVTLTSDWKKQWMLENRFAGGAIFTPDDEPDDGDFDNLDDSMLTDVQGLMKLPPKGNLTGITRVVNNDQASSTKQCMPGGPSDMDMEDE